MQQPRDRRHASNGIRRGAVALLMAAGCVGAPHHEPHPLPIISSPIELPRGFRPPITPLDNPLTTAKARLGRYLFYDTRLSANGTQSCGSCHQQKLAFTDGRVHAIGSTGETHYRNTMGLSNAGYRRPLTWADPNVTTLEQQVLVPLTNTDPIELGMNGRFHELLERIRRDERYTRMFGAAFPGESETVTIDNVARAIASFERTLISGGSPYDRLVAGGDSGALSPAAWRGMRLFLSPRLGCSNCHGGPDFGTPASGSPFQNNGGLDPAQRTRDHGLRNKSGRRRDEGKFRVPSLRNVAATAPYMHDGSVASLSEVVDDYAAGGRVAHLRQRRPARSAGVRPFRMTQDEKQDLLAFLESLTDEHFLEDPRFSNPWN